MRQFGPVVNMTQDKMCAIILRSSRRDFLRGLGSIAIPAIVPIASLMPLRGLIMPIGQLPVPNAQLIQLAADLESARDQINASMDCSRNIRFSWDKGYFHPFSDRQWRNIPINDVVI